MGAVFGCLCGHYAHYLVAGPAAIYERSDELHGHVRIAYYEHSRQADPEAEQFGAYQPRHITEEHQEYEAQDEAVDRHKLGGKDGIYTDEVPENNEQHAGERADQQSAGFAEAPLVDTAVV